MEQCSNKRKKPISKYCGDVIVEWKPVEYNYPNAETLEGEKQEIWKKSELIHKLKNK